MAVFLPADLRIAAALSAVALTAALAAPSALAAAPGKSWTAPVAVGDSPTGTGTVTRVALSPSGRGTVGWSVAGADPSIFARDFSSAGVLGNQTTVLGGGVISAVARDPKNNAFVSGRAGGTAPFAFAAAKSEKATAWSTRTTASGASVDVPAAYGLKDGFILANTNSFIPTSTKQAPPTASALGFTSAALGIPLGKQLTQVETGDNAHGFDGSNWALSSKGFIITGGRRETAKPKNGKAPASVPALIRLGKSPTRNSILGIKTLGATAVSTAGVNTAVAGLAVQQTNAVAQRGVPAVALGGETSLSEATTIPGVPDRRALEVDVAALAGGGAIITWLQQTSSTAKNRQGQPKWAVVDEDGEVTSRGVFVNATDARDLRIVRAGTSSIAVWVRGTGTKSRFNAAQIKDDTVRIIKAPTGAPMGRAGVLGSTQLTAVGSHVALSFVDLATNSVRLAVLPT